MPSTWSCLRIALLISTLMVLPVPSAMAASESPAPASSAEASLSPVADCVPATAAPDLSPAPSVDPASKTAPSDAAAATGACEGAEPPASPEPSEVAVQAGDLWFAPNEITISSQGATTITLEDVGVTVHNLTVDELEIQVGASLRSPGKVTLVDPAPGTYQFYCSVSGHREAGMVGTLVVE